MALSWWAPSVGEFLGGFLFGVAGTPSFDEFEETIPSIWLSPSSSSSSISTDPISLGYGWLVKGGEEERRERRTLAIDIRMLPKTILHTLEPIHTVHPLGLRLAKHKA